MTPRALRLNPLTARDVQARLAAVLGLPAGSRFDVETSALGGNAWNTAFVHRHRIRFADARPGIDCVEKKLRKLPGIAGFEPALQAWVAAWQPEGARLRVPHLGALETPLATFLYSQAVSGPHAHLASVAADAAAGIAELEAVSAAHLSALDRREARLAARMDFFRPWTLWRPRYDLATALRRAGLRGEAGARQVVRLARAMQPHLHRLARQAQATPRCISHLDVISKNLIANAQGLHLIDWGEGRVGRFGFDAGSCLHRLLRANEMRAFEAARATFVESYLAHLPQAVSRAQAERNLLFFLALRSACYFLRPGVLQGQGTQPAAVAEKLAWLLGQLERPESQA